MERTCIKCGFVHRRASGGADEACPACGAIYAKAVASGTVRVGQPALAPPAVAVADDRRPAPTAPRTPGGATGPADILDELRRETRYAALRAAVRLAHACSLALAALGLLGGLALLFAGRTWIALGAMLASLLLGVFARVFKEGALLLADLGDATLRLAGRERGGP